MQTGTEADVMPTTLELAVIALAEAADKFARGPEAETMGARNNLLRAARHYSEISRFSEQRRTPNPAQDSRKDGETRVLRKPLSGYIFEFRWDGIRRVWTRDCQPGATWNDEELHALGFFFQDESAPPNVNPSPISGRGM